MTAKLAARDGESASVSTPSENGEAAEKLGMTVAPLTPKMAEEMNLPGTETGVVVTEVDPSGVAAEAGFRPGDVVKKVNGKDVKTVADLKAAMAARKNGPTMVLVARDGGSLFVAVPSAKS